MKLEAYRLQNDAMIVEAMDADWKGVWNQKVGVRLAAGTNG